LNFLCLAKILCYRRMGCLWTWRRLWTKNGKSVLSRCNIFCRCSSKIL